MIREILLVVGDTLRSLVAMTFLLSAAWKIAHPMSARLAVRRMTARFLPLVVDRLVLVVVLVIEVSVAIALYVPTWQVVGSVVSICTLVLFSAALISSSASATSCGCWREIGPGVSKGSYLLRNAVIVVVAIGGVLLPRSSPVSVAQVAFSTAVGLLLAVLLLELPGVASIASAHAPAR